VRRSWPANETIVHTAIPTSLPEIDPAWDDWISSFPEATIFHSTAWANVLRRTYGHQPFYCRYPEAGEPSLLLPMMEVRSWLTGCRGVGLPFTDLCAPLVRDGSSVMRIVEMIAGLARTRRWRHLELRGGPPPVPAARPHTSFHGHSLDLRAGTDVLFALLANSVRRAIRKAERSKVAVEMASSLAAVRDFFHLHVRTRRRHGLPPQPWSFFRNIHSAVIEPGSGFVATARHSSRPVAAAIFFTHGKTSLYKFGASEKQTQHLRGNNLVMWEAIRYLSARGFRTLHLGRTSLDNEGLRRYKLSWGSSEERIDYYRFDPATGACCPPPDRGPHFHTRVFSRLPIPLNRLIGAAIYPHLD
jgi:CelD/BcsL family acetyltransferase involved in cellulose biosynthesis